VSNKLDEIAHEAFPESDNAEGRCLAALQQAYDLGRAEAEAELDDEVQAWCEKHAEIPKRLPEPRHIGLDTLALLTDGRLLCSQDDVVKLLQPLEAEVERLRAAYLDLIMQVANKWPGENRHDTAKRYIVEREAQSAQGSEAKSALQQGGGEVSEEKKPCRNKKCREWLPHLSHES
jgi:hypothetical protein